MLTLLKLDFQNKETTVKKNKKQKQIYSCAFFSAQPFSLRE